MSVTVVPIGSRLTMRLNTGLDENMNPVYRNRSFHNLKASASDTDVFELAQEIGSLQVHTLDSVRRVNENELEAI